MKTATTVNRSRRGAVALLFVPIIGLVLVFVMMLMNAAQIALQKSMTANAADAACLAGGSYLASGANECAWILRRQRSVLALVQAIYLVPFCQDAASRTYARELWESFTEREGPEGYGPMRYFHFACAGAIVESQKLGAAAAYGAYFNNLINRNAGGVYNGSYAEQHRLYSNPNDYTGPTLTWSAGGFDHTSNFNMTYPALPVLPVWEPVSTQWSGGPAFLSWERQPTTWDYYDCEPQGQGYRARNVFAGMEEDDLIYPLSANTGLKKYEVELVPDRVPGVNEFRIDNCSQWVCGITRFPLDEPWPNMVANRFARETVTTSAFATHVATGGGAGLGSWTFRSENVRSSCRSQTTLPSLEIGGWLPSNRVRVSLTSAR